MKKVMYLNTTYSTAKDSMSNSQKHTGYTGLEELRIEIPEHRYNYQYVYKPMDRI